MIDEFRKIALTALPDLIAASNGLTLHDIDVFEVLSYQTNEFTYCLTAFESETSKQAIVLSTRSVKDLSRAWTKSATIEIGIALTGIRFDVVGLELVADTAETILRVLSIHRLARIG